MSALLFKLIFCKKYEHQGRIETALLRHLVHHFALHRSDFATRASIDLRFGKGK